MHLSGLAYIMNPTTRLLYIIGRFAAEALIVHFFKAMLCTKVTCGDYHHTMTLNPKLLYTVN